MSIKTVVPLTTPAGTNEQNAVSQITTTGNGNSREYPELGSFTRGKLFLDVSAVGGTTRTLDVTFEEQDPVSAKWNILATFPQQSAVTPATPLAPIIVLLDALTYRLRWVVAGTGSPTLTWSCCIVAGCEEPVL